MKNAMVNYMKNTKNDELYTPRYAIYPLLKYLPKNLKIWECTDYGSSNITKVLKESGYEVITTHKDNFNFLTDTPDFGFDMIITNPPYSLKDEFLARCYGYCKPFCLLLPLTSLEGVKRGKMFRQYGIELLVLDRRINFIYINAKKSCWFNTSWFCHNVLSKQLIFEELLKENSNEKEC